LLVQIPSPFLQREESDFKFPLGLGVRDAESRSFRWGGLIFHRAKLKGMVVFFIRLQVHQFMLEFSSPILPNPLPPFRIGPASFDPSPTFYICKAVCPLNISLSPFFCLRYRRGPRNWVLLRNSQLRGRKGPNPLLSDPSCQWQAALGKAVGFGQLPRGSLFWKS